MWLWALTLDRLFQFKRFPVEDDQSTMKVGTDAVLLGAWVNVDGAKTILDVGTGCGVIALMLAQRSSATIDAVEIDAASFEQAKQNFEASSWNISAHNNTIQNFTGGPYDLIVTNPPFFSKSLLPPSKGRQNARHTETLSFDDLLMATKRLLHDEGRLAVVLPVIEGDQFRSIAVSYGLHCIRSLAFYTRYGKPQERWLFEFSNSKKIPVEEKLVLYEGDEWSAGYRELTKDYYL